MSYKLNQFTGGLKKESGHFGLEEGDLNNLEPITFQ